MNRSLLALVMLGALGLAACASDEDPVRYREIGPGGFGRGGGGDREGRGREMFNLFISPSGKPYRAPVGQPYPVATWFAAADADHDGKLTQAEFRKDAEAFFRELDANHDGVIDGFEQQAYEQKIAPEILPRVEGLAAGEGMDLTLGRDPESAGGRRRSSGEGGPEIGGSRSVRGGARAVAGDRRPQGAGLFGLLNEPEPVAASDGNFDGKISLEEFLASADRRFAALDTKNRGYLMLSELPKTPVQEAAERAAARAKNRPPGPAAKPN